MFFPKTSLSGKSKLHEGDYGRRRLSSYDYPGRPFQQKVDYRFSDGTLHYFRAEEQRLFSEIEPLRASLQWISTLRANANREYLPTASAHTANMDNAYHVLLSGVGPAVVYPLSRDSAVFFLEGLVQLELARGNRLAYLRLSVEA